MQSACIVNVIDEVGQVCRNIVEGLEFGDVDRFHFQGFHEALGLRIVIGVSSAAH